LTVEIRPHIYQIPAQKGGSHIYLLRGANKNMLIDTGTAANFPSLEASLSELGLKVADIHFVVLTHEHFDHSGATCFFFQTAVVAAHRLAANKIELQDDFVTMIQSADASSVPFRADVWLESDTLIDLGNYRLRALHTPGHVSGCICLYEPNERLLFTGDTVLSGGTLSGIFASGSISDYMNSLERLSALKIDKLCPGHGRLSDDPEGDISRGMEYARDLFEDTKLLSETLVKGQWLDT